LLKQFDVYMMMLCLNDNIHEYFNIYYDNDEIHTFV